jgi:hypothetical protein
MGRALKGVVVTQLAGQFRRQVSGAIVPDLLQRDHIGIELPQSGRDGRPALLPGPIAPPDVPGHDPQTGLDQVIEFRIRWCLSLDHAKPLNRFPG